MLTEEEIFFFGAKSGTQLGEISTNLRGQQSNISFLLTNEKHLSDPTEFLYVFLTALVLLHEVSVILLIWSPLRSSLFSGCLAISLCPSPVALLRDIFFESFSCSHPVLW